MASLPESPLRSVGVAPTPALGPVGFDCGGFPGPLVSEMFHLRWEAILPASRWSPRSVRIPGNGLDLPVSMASVVLVHGQI